MLPDADDGPVDELKVDAAREANCHVPIFAISQRLIEEADLLENAAEAARPGGVVLASTAVARTQLLVEPPTTTTVSICRSMR